MKINSTDIHGYFINPDHFSHRLNDITNTINSLNLASVTRIAFNEKFSVRNVTMSNAHITLIEKAISDKNFPFLLLEDDAMLINNFPTEFDIPNEAELVYWGGSLYDCGGIKPNMYIENYDENYYRVYNMLSAHAVLIPNLKSAELIVKIYNEAISMTDFNDIYLALYSKDHIFLTPKNGPYFYQNDFTSSITKFLWLDVSEKFLK